MGATVLHQAVGADGGHRQRAELQMRSATTRARMGRAAIADERVRVGSGVRLRDLDLNSEWDFVVTDGSAPESGLYPMPAESPVATALLGRKPGDVVEVAVPAGTVRYRIQSVLWPRHEDLRLLPLVTGRDGAVIPVRPVGTHGEEPQE